MGGVDTVLNHEVLARLTQRAEARPELGLHVLREAIWASLFFGLAWFEWHGAAALVIVALVAAEIAITAWMSSSRTASACCRRTSACCTFSSR